MYNAKIAKNGQNWETHKETFSSLKAKMEMLCVPGWLNFSWSEPPPPTFRQILDSFILPKFISFFFFDYSTEKKDEN